MNPRNHPSRQRVHDALKQIGQGTQADIRDITGMSIDAIRNTLSRHAANGYFKRVGEIRIKSSGQTRDIWIATEPDTQRTTARPPGKLAPIIGAQTIRDWQQSQDERINKFDIADVGRFDVVRVNAYGYTVITPYYSRSAAELEQKMSGGEIVAVN